METQNRKEIFLKALANGEEANIKPLTREEILLKKQAERENASGGASSGGGAFVVNLSKENGEYSVDKSIGEILDALNNGVVPVISYDKNPYKYVLPLNVVKSDELQFQTIETNGAQIIIVSILIAYYEGEIVFIGEFAHGATFEELFNSNNTSQ